MKTSEKLGIWMDHSEAHLITYSDKTHETQVIRRERHAGPEDHMDRSEKQWNNKDDNQQSAYYKKLEAELSQYYHVLLFGPTDAKSELFNLIRKNPKYDKVTITVKNSDKMTDKEMHAFVQDHFKPILLDMP